MMKNTVLSLLLGLTAYRGQSPNIGNIMTKHGRSFLVLCRFFALTARHTLTSTMSRTVTALSSEAVASATESRLVLRDALTSILKCGGRWARSTCIGAPIGMPPVTHSSSLRKESRLKGGLAGRSCHFLLDLPIAPHAPNTPRILSALVELRHGQNGRITPKDYKQQRTL